MPKKDLVTVAPDPRAVPVYWGRQGDDLHAGTPGTLAPDVHRPRPTGPTTSFFRASIGRRVRVYVDGRQIAAPRWRESYPGQSMLLATLRLTRGTHQLEVVRGGGGLLPGTGNDAAGTTTSIGSIVFDPTAEREVVRSVPASQLDDLCASHEGLDWIEVWRPNRRSS